MKKLFPLFFIVSLLICLVPSHSVSAEVDYAKVSHNIIEKAEVSIAQYRVADAALTGNEISRLYFDVFDASGMEFSLNIHNPEAKQQIEASFSVLILSAMQGDEKKIVHQHWLRLKEQLLSVSPASNELTEENYFHPLLIFIANGGEAIMLIIVLLTYLRRLGAADKQYVIYLGVSIALCLVVFQRFFSVSGGGQGVVNAGAILLAALLLLYLSLWIFLKRRDDCWEHFIHNSLDKALPNKNKLAIGLSTLLAVYYAGDNVVFSYQELATNSSQQNLLSIAALLSTGLLLFYGYIKLLKKLPLSHFYRVTSGLMLVLAVSACVNALVDLQRLGL